MERFNCHILKLLREQRGLSQSAFAERLKVKQAFISKIEKGTILPTDEMVDNIAKITNYPTKFFYIEEQSFGSGLVFHRKRTALSAAKKATLEAEAKLRALDVKLLFQDADICSNVLKRDNLSATDMAIAIRKHWSLPDKPIENLVEVLEVNNIAVIKFDFKTDLLDGLWIPMTSDFPIICIALNSNKAFTPDRHRFTLAHELGHALLHQDAFPSKEVEAEANEFASELLFPRELAKKEIIEPVTLNKLRDLKYNWKVSIASLLFKANKLDKIGDSNCRRLWALMAAMGMRKNEPLCGIEEEQTHLIFKMLDDFSSKNKQSIYSFLSITKSEYNARYKQI